MGKNTEKHGFNSSSKRFNGGMGIHPDLIPGENISTGPGHYDPIKYRCGYKLKSPVGEPWTRKLQIEEFSEFRDFKNIGKLMFERYLESLRGPGTYCTKDINKDRQLSSIYNDTSFGTVKRFPSVGKDYKVPPGVHSGNVIEFKMKKQLTQVMPFEWDAFKDRFKLDVPKFRLPPTLYPEKTKGTNVEDILTKRGTSNITFGYFTGPRDDSTIKNHLASPAFRSPDIYYLLPSDIDHLLTDKINSKRGKFCKATRFPKKPVLKFLQDRLSTCYRDPHDPGPADYNTSSYKCIQRLPPSKHPFDSSARCRDKKSKEIHPGPGRYNIRRFPMHKSRKGDESMYSTRESVDTPTNPFDIGGEKFLAI